MPTFLGNHDMGRIGYFLQTDNPGAGDAEWLARDRLAHELMFFSRGNPVVYYGDEQGFTGSGGDQVARQTMFASQVPEYLDDDLLGTSATHAQSNFLASHPLYQTISELAKLTDRHPALRNGAQQDRYASDSAGIYAFSRTDRDKQREYVVALNNSEQPQTAVIPTYDAKRLFRLIYGEGAKSIKTDTTAGLTVTVPALSAVVYETAGRVPRSKAAPSISLVTPTPATESRGRMQVSATVGGSSFYEVTFYANTGDGNWTSIGTDDSAPYRVFHDVSALPSGQNIQYRAVVLDNARHSATSQAVTAAVPAPTLKIEAPAEGSNVRGIVEVRTIADPERASHVVTTERRTGGENGTWTVIGTDDSSPAYTVFDGLSPLNLAAEATIEYRASLTEPNGTVVTSPIRTVNYAGLPATSVQLHYFRPAGDYGDPPTGWGPHMWGDAVDPTVLAQIAWDKPWQRATIEIGWAVYDIPLVDDTEPVNFIMHLPSGDSVPATREPGGDRSFRPIDYLNGVYLVQGDTTMYVSLPGN